jgi:hypothetical protein
MTGYQLGHLLTKNCKSGGGFDMIYVVGKPTENEFLRPRTLRILLLMGSRIPLVLN